MDVPDNAPEVCPGTGSKGAGKASGCAGCPNQSLCASGTAKLTVETREPEAVAALRICMQNINHRLLILSGKGGVGKSSVSVCIARGLTRRLKSSLRMSELSSFPLLSHQCNRVGILDLDLCGPSIPCLTGCMNEKVHESQSGWSPVYVSDNLSVMSIGFLLDSLDQAVVWRGPRKNALIKQFLTSVCWTDDDDHSLVEDGNKDADDKKLDFLVVDMPPGTSDEHLSLAQYLKSVNCLDYAVIVTTPQEIALGDVRKEINFCEKVGLPILGVVENMTEFVCPSCHQASSVFPATTGGASSLCGESPLHLNLLGKLPLDPKLAKCLDEGRCPFVEADGEEAVFVNNGDQPEPPRLTKSDQIMIAYDQLIDNILLQLSKRTSGDVDMSSSGL